VLVSSVNCMKIKIYLEYWHQDYGLLKRYIYDQVEEMKIEFLCRTQLKPCFILYVKSPVSRSLEFDYKRRI
jgi:hypothetical protein